MLQVPANLAGYGAFSLGQLKILQEVIALTVFVPFAVFYMGQPLIAGLPLGRVAAGEEPVFFIFRS